ncbi:hypothetical protein GJ496_008965 [Pomphorhynchus laevis]|nr:hypothetical protein GJ496_008965 [Pomphorhynchus laevis]
MKYQQTGVTYPDVLYPISRKLSFLLARAASHCIRKSESRKDNHHQAYKPKASHHRNIEFEADKKLANGLKRERSSKDVVMQTVLSGFEKHPFLNIRDLCRITNQPVPFLKEILKELCQYNSKPPNKFTYELKPEYRHYPSK